MVPTPPGSSRKGPSRDSRKESAPHALLTPLLSLCHMEEVLQLPEEKPLVSRSSSEPHPTVACLALPYPAPILSANPIPPRSRLLLVSPRSPSPPGFLFSDSGLSLRTSGPELGRGVCQILRLGWQSLSRLGRGGRQGTRGSEEEMGGWEERKGG